MNSSHSLITPENIDRQNILVNCYSLYRPVFDIRVEMRDHRRNPDVVYCLFDFDGSPQLPVDTPLNNCRVAASGAMVALSPYHPLDVVSGEAEYNPFAFDVACLGNILELYLSVSSPCLW